MKTIIDRIEAALKWAEEYTKGAVSSQMQLVLREAADALVVKDRRIEELVGAIKKAPHTIWVCNEGEGCQCWKAKALAPERSAR